MGIGIGPSGNVYVTDFEYRVVRKPPTGALLAEWNGAAPGVAPFGAPTGIAVDAGEHVFVSDVDGRIKKFTGTGTLLTWWGGNGRGDGLFSGAYDVALDDSASIFVADQGNGQVQKFGYLPTGSRQSTWSEVTIRFR